MSPIPALKMKQFYIFLFCFCFILFCLFLETPRSNSKTSKNNQRKSSGQLGFLAHCTSPLSIVHFRWPFITVEMLFLTKKVLPVLAPTLTSFIFSLKKKCSHTSKTRVTTRKRDTVIDNRAPLELVIAVVRENSRNSRRL